jgi:hypothetical protein
VLATPNLYGDLTKFGMDYVQRSRSPLHRVETFVRVVRELSRAERRALVAKLFCGTDFPNFTVGRTHADAGLDPDVIAASDLRFQVHCMQEAFGDDFDEARMVERFLALLPATA